MLVAGTLAVATSDAATQQFLEVDMDAGRELVGGPEYSFGDWNAVVDYGRRLVLVTDVLDPLAVTAYSLDDGSVQGVFGGRPAGDGPGELVQLDAVATSTEGVYVSGSGNVLFWSWSGAFLHQWRPSAPRTNALCVIDGRPAVTLPKGLVFRGDNGESVALGGEARTGWDWTDVSTLDDAIRIRWGYSSTLMACAESVAYVLTGMDHVLTEYKLMADPRSVAMPPELLEAAHRRMKLSSGNAFYRGYEKLFLADDGRLVITTRAQGLSGAVLDRGKDCYALLKNSPPVPTWSYVGMFGDSIVTMEGSRQPTTMIVDGKPRHAVVSDKTHIFVRPVRPASGEPCS